MAEPPSRPEKEPEIADVNWLLGDQPTKKAPPPSQSPAPAVDHGEGYAIEGLDHDDSAPAPPIPPPPPRPAAPKSRPKSETGGTVRPTSRPEATVDEVWTRGAEWGPNLVAIGLAAVVSGGLIVFALSQEWFAVAFLLLLLAGAGLLLLSYPIAITLERPVRMTPEQAVRDYYAALAHHVPHYRRMWLLLSSAGKTTSWFGSLEGFKRYWADRLATLKGSRAGKFTPLKFQIEDFKSEKITGLNAVPVKFTLKVFIRGQQAGGPIATYRIETGMVKGPDRMWYLDDGTLPVDRGREGRE